jgi:hypothetical protein
MANSDFIRYSPLAIRTSKNDHTFSNGTSILLRSSSHCGTGRFFERMGQTQARGPALPSNEVALPIPEIDWKP